MVSHLLSLHPEQHRLLLSSCEQRALSVQSSPQRCCCAESSLPRCQARSHGGMSSLLLTSAGEPRDCRPVSCCCCCCCAVRVTGSSAVPSVQGRSSSRRTLKIQQKHQILPSPTQLYTSTQRYSQDRADVRPEERLLLLTPCLWLEQVCAYLCLLSRANSLLYDTTFFRKNSFKREKKRSVF